MENTSEQTLEPQPATGVSRDILQPARTGATKDVRFHVFVIDTGWNSAASKRLLQLNAWPTPHVNHVLHPE